MDLVDVIPLLPSSHMQQVPTVIVLSTNIVSISESDSPEEGVLRCL